MDWTASAHHRFGIYPTTSSRIWANEYDGWDGVELNAFVRIGLGKPHEALPINNPPPMPYTMLPRSSLVQVTKEDEHFDALRDLVPNTGYGTLFVTLHERHPEGRGKPHVDVRVDGDRVEDFPQTSQRFLRLVRHLHERGLVTACWGDITGSAVAAEVRIDGVKANEATPEVWDGPPATIPPLVPELADAESYDVAPMMSLLKPLALFQPAVPRIPDQPPDGSVVRFSKSRGRYNYVAVRRGDRWETTSTGNYGSINEVMDWTNLALRVTEFEIATGWAAVDRRDDPRVRSTSRSCASR